MPITVVFMAVVTVTVVTVVAAAIIAAMAISVTVSANPVRKPAATFRWKEK